MIQVSHNISAVQKHLSRLAGKVGTIQPALKTIGETLVNSTRERWDQQIDPDGKDWQPLKPATLKRKAKKKKPLKILLQDDQLRFTISPQVEENTLIIGSPQKYAATHQLGRKIGKGTIPARPFLGISKQDEADILDDIEQQLKF